jgi:hypothetical protein
MGSVELAKWNDGERKSGWPHHALEFEVMEANDMADAKVIANVARSSEGSCRTRIFGIRETGGAPKEENIDSTLEIEIQVES